MNYKMEEQIPLHMKNFYILSLSQVIIIPFFFIIFLGKLGILLLLIYIIGQIFFVKFLYYRSAIRLISDNDLLIVELPLQKPLFIQLENISKIEKTRKWARGMHYFIIEYDDKIINTFLMSNGLKENLYGFMEELQRRVDNAKALASIKND